MKTKKDRWAEDTMITVSRDTRAKLKLQAALRAISLKDYLSVLANQEELKNVEYINPMSSGGYDGGMR